MTDEERLSAVLGAVTAAIVGEGENMVVDLEALENGLAAAGINCTSTTNRGALVAELSVVRDDLRTQRTRARHAAPINRATISELVERLERREREITDLLWPKR